jgi:hypothetical protein
MARYSSPKRGGTSDPLAQETRNGPLQALHDARFSFQMPALLLQVAADLFHPRPVSFQRSNPWNIDAAAAMGARSTSSAAIPHLVLWLAASRRPRWPALPQASAQRGPRKFAARRQRDVLSIRRAAVAPGSAIW